MGAGALPQRRDPIAQLGIIAALPAEARLLQRCSAGVEVLCAGVGAHNARVAAERLLNDGAQALLSWGSAGALDPSLPPGCLVLPDCVIDSRGTKFIVDSDWHARLRQRLHGHLDVHTGALLESPSMVSGIGQKRSLFASYDAVAVDMESATIARVAGSAGVPFVAVRAIADPADMALPGCVGRAIDTQGRINTTRLLSSVALRPSDWAAVARLGWCFRRAQHTLAEVARLCGTTLLAPQPAPRT
ncbi:MAG: hypothetical protein ACREUA_03985 [Burkholderiales bacterium]